MKKRTFFLAGVLLALLFFFIGGLVKSHLILTNISGSIALICFLISGASTGTFISGDRIRANLGAEDRDERRERINLAIKTTFLVLPF